MSDMLFSLSKACSSISPLAIGLAAGCRVFSILRALLYRASFIMPNALTYFHLVRRLYLRFGQDLLWSLNLHVAAPLGCNVDALQRVLMCFPNLALTAVRISGLTAVRSLSSWYIFDACAILVALPNWANLWRRQATSYPMMYASDQSVDGIPNSVNSWCATPLSVIEVCNTSQLCSLVQ